MSTSFAVGARSSEQPFPSISGLTTAAQERLSAFNWQGEPAGTLFLDKDHLLESAGDWEFAAELLVDMLTELGTSLPAIEDVSFAGGNCDSTLDVSQPSSIVAISAEEATTLAKAAHGVKGAALNLGLQQLAKAALGVELIGKALADRKVGESPGAAWCGADQELFSMLPLLCARLRAISIDLQDFAENMPTDG